MLPGVVWMPSPEKASMKLALISPSQLSSSAQLGSKPEQIIDWPVSSNPLQDRSAASGAVVSAKLSANAKPVSLTSGVVSDLASIRIFSVIKKPRPRTASLAYPDAEVETEPEGGD